MVEVVVESAASLDGEWSGVCPKSYGGESQAPDRDRRSALSGPARRRPQAAWYANPRGAAVRGALHRVPSSSFSNWRQSWLVIQETGKWQGLSADSLGFGGILTDQGTLKQRACRRRLPDSHPRIPGRPLGRGTRRPFRWLIASCTSTSTSPK